MNEPNLPSLTDSELETTIGFLRRKEGSWVEWGQACQKLQKSGMSAQAIFEQTGFEPIHQNQLTVAAQVYEGLANGEASGFVLDHFQRKGSDILYELRILAQSDRIKTAELAVTLNLDALTAREVAKAVKEFTLLRQAPEGFTSHPGDAVAYQAWKIAQNERSPQEKVRLISRALKFAHSNTARATVEKLLSSAVVSQSRPAPRLPIYRLESDDAVPRLVPVVGRLPLGVHDFKAVPIVEEIAPFGMVQFSGDCAWIALPGWQVVHNTEDGVIILCDTNSLEAASGQQIPSSFPDKPEEILVLIDRAQRQWDASSYFLVEQDGQLRFQWFDTAPEVALLGRVVLLMRQKRILDEEIAQDVWQLDDE